MFWKFSTEQTLDDIQEGLDEVRNEFCLGNFRVSQGLCESKTHLDIHLVRLTFLDIMNLPPSFAYNEYVNHCLDTTTLKIAKNTWTTWVFLLGFIFAMSYIEGRE